LKTTSLAFQYSSTKQVCSIMAWLAAFSTGDMELDKIWLFWDSFIV